MKQKYLILSYAFSGKFRDDEKGPADLKTYIGIHSAKMASLKEYKPGEFLFEDEKEVMVGCLIRAEFDSLDQCEKFIKEDKSGDALFVLPIYELSK